MSKTVSWIMIVVALVVGIGIGFYAERTRATQKLEETKMAMQVQIDNAKKMLEEKLAQPTGTPSAVMMAKTGYLTDAKGMALYVFDKDTKDTSTCTGQCLTIWPPYAATSPIPTPAPDHLGTFKRTDGTLQYTWDGKPLYYYEKDKETSDKYGDGVNGVWHLAK